MPFCSHVLAISHLLRDINIHEELKPLCKKREAHRPKKARGALSMQPDDGVDVEDEGDGDVPEAEGEELIVETLLERGAAIDKQNRNGVTGMSCRRYSAENIITRVPRRARADDPDGRARRAAPQRPRRPRRHPFAFWLVP